MILLKTTGTITPKQDKTNIFFDFDVPKNIEKLIIDYSYAPKIVEDKQAAVNLIKEKAKQYNAEGSAEEYLPVKNLITLSLNDSKTYRGAAHRQADRQHHEISTIHADAGFIKGKINSGKWQIALNIHCCACKVNYYLKITGEER